MARDSNRASIATRLAALPGFPHLRGPRIRLRGPSADDTAALFALYSDPLVMRYWSRAPMTSPGEASALIDEILDGFTQRSLLNWVVVDHRDRDLVIGTCTLLHFDARHHRAEIGYALLPQRWGQGLAREAVSLALDWGFRDLGLHRIEADIDPRNDASRGLLVRLGFLSEGVLRERFFVEGRAIDSEILGLLASDWCRPRE